MNNHTLWVEKYRPENVETYLGNELVVEKIKKFIETGDIPHLLLAGRAGVGKTTLAKMLVNNIECDSLFINASDENNIETIRTKIKGFVSAMSFKPLKIVVLDEADYITPNAQAALRNLMEAFSSTARFILTCNYQERIIEPLVSRTQSFDLRPPTQKDVMIHVAAMLEAEEIKFNPNDVKTLVNTYYPDIRKIINTTQLFSGSGMLKLDYSQLVESDVKLSFFTLLTDKSKSVTVRFKEIRELIQQNSVREFSEFYSYLYENLESFEEANHPEIILAIADAQYRDSFVVDKEINFAAVTHKILTLV
ncbi:MAG: AAA family ATPase [Betaproteobacteria bacterium]|jgi:DNA polymerase III delta prime subunit